MLNLILSVLVVAFIIGLVMGFICLSIDRHRKKSTRILNLKAGVTLEYDCSQPGIYETIKAVIDGK
jgi:hypothetical protein